MTGSEMNNINTMRKQLTIIDRIKQGIWISISTAVLKLLVLWQIGLSVNIPYNNPNNNIRMMVNSGCDL